MVKAAGGKILGAVRAPLATADFSTYLLQAKASGAKVIGLANAGTDMQNCVKQAAEFGMTQGGVRLATLLMQSPTSIRSACKPAQGLVLEQFVLLGHDRQDPRLDQALRCQDGGWCRRPCSKLVVTPAYPLAEGGQGGRNHRHRGGRAKMHATPVNDFYNTDVHIDPNGCVRHKMYIWQVKSPAESKYKWDFYKPVATMDGKDPSRRPICSAAR